MNLKLSLLCLFLATTNLFAQKITKINSTNGLTMELQLHEEDGRPVNHIIFDKPKLGNSATQSDEKRLIIRLKGNPLAKSNTSNAKMRASNLQDSHRKFVDDFAKIHANANSKFRGKAKIHHEYKNTFNGFSVTTDAAGETKLKALSYVASVAEDKKVESIDLTSNEIIGADKVWSQYDITGKGVVIGIIDTGIDYTHPDLGGSMGTDKKVIGGYDFVNEDNDPIDDHGHGTHVAGIAAANGSIKGVAPDAKLMAFKVLSAEGWGYDSWILAAIERTVDPDQNPATDDAVNIVNMSLGRQADANEPYSEAIANATALGVTFVVAAGNNYYYQSVGTPGVAPKAITVAATDSFDWTASFSSKGPTADYRIKPDVAAPGVDITSCFLGSQYQTWSGTSMATPHVAGAAALILEKHPDWSPDMIKSVLMNSAKKSDEILWHQGAGRIDILKATNPEFIVSPGSISLGLAPIGESSVKIITTSIQNLSDHAKEFSLDVEGNIKNSSISISIEPNIVTLDPGQSTNITIQFDINGSLPVSPYTEGYFGILKTTSENTVVETPISLLNLKVTKLLLSEPLPFYVFISGIDDLYFQGIQPTSTEVEVILPAFSCDILAYYDQQHFVIKESVDKNTESNIYLGVDLAKNEIVFNFKDLENKDIKINPIEDVGTTLFTARRFVGFYSYLEDTFYISDNSYALFDATLRDTVNGKYLDIAAGSGYGQDHSMVIENEPFTKVTLHEDEAVNYEFYYHSKIFHLYRGGTDIYNTYPLTFSNEFDIYVSKRQPKDNFQYSKAMLLPPGGQPGKKFESGYFGAFENNLIKFNEFGTSYWPAFITYPSGNQYDYWQGNCLLKWNGIVNYDNNQLTLSENFKGLFNYTHGDRSNGEIQYSLSASGQILETGSIENPSVGDNWNTWMDNGSILTFNVSPQKYDLNLQYAYRVRGHEALAKVNATFNPVLIGNNPILMKTLSLDSRGISTDQISYGDDASIVANITKCLYYYSGCPQLKTDIFYKGIDGTDWIKLNSINLGNDSLVADLPQLLTPGYYSLKLISSDTGEDSLTYELSPAFRVIEADNSLPKVILKEPLNHSININRYPTFEWYSVSEALSYTIQLSKNPSFAIIEFEATIDSTVLRYPTELDFNKVYYWRVKANYEDGSSLWSTGFDFRTSDLKVELIDPVNNSTLTAYTFTSFTWNKINEAYYYQIQKSKDPDFSTLEFDYYTLDTTATDYWRLIEPNLKYYWRVRSYTAQGPNTWSDIFSFISTPYQYPLSVSLSLPSDKKINAPINPTFYWYSFPQATSFRFQLSTQENFSTIQFDLDEANSPFSLPYNLNYGTKYFWRVQAINEWGVSEWADAFNFTTIYYTNDFTAYAYPNPITTETELIFTIANAGDVFFEIINAKGGVTKQISEFYSTPGKKSFTLRNTDLNSAGGVFFCKIKTTESTEVVKLILLSQN